MGEQAGAGGGGTSEKDTEWVGAGGLSADEADGLSGDFRAVWEDEGEAPGKAVRKQTLIGMAPASVSRDSEPSARVSKLEPPTVASEGPAANAGTPASTLKSTSDGPPRPKATMLGLGAVKLPASEGTAAPAQSEVEDKATVQADAAPGDDAVTASLPQGDTKKLTARHTPIAKQTASSDPPSKPEGEAKAVERDSASPTAATSADDPVNQDAEATGAGTADSETSPAPQTTDAAAPEPTTEQAAATALTADQDAATATADAGDAARAKPAKSDPEASSPTTEPAQPKPKESKHQAQASPAKAKAVVVASAADDVYVPPPPSASPLKYLGIAAAVAGLVGLGYLLNSSGDSPTETPAAAPKRAAEPTTATPAHAASPAETTTAAPDLAAEPSAEPAPIKASTPAAAAPAAEPIATTKPPAAKPPTSTPPAAKPPAAKPPAAATPTATPKPATPKPTAPKPTAPTPGKIVRDTPF